MTDDASVTMDFTWTLPQETVSHASQTVLTVLDPVTPSARAAISTAALSTVSCLPPASVLLNISRIRQADARHVTLVVALAQAAPPQLVQPARTERRLTDQADVYVLSLLQSCPAPEFVSTATTLASLAQIHLLISVLDARLMLLCKSTEAVDATQGTIWTEMVSAKLATTPAELV